MHDPLGRGVRDVALVPERRRSRARRARCARTTRASPQIRSATIGLRLCGIADEPFWPRPNGSSTSRTSVRARWRISSANRVERGGDHARASASSSACRSRCDHLRRDRVRLEAEPLAGDPLDLRVDRRRTCRPAPESLPDAHSPRARARGASRSRSSSNAQPASFQPNVVGSAWTPWDAADADRVPVLLARGATTAASARSSPSTTSPPPRRICSESAVSTTSDEVRP